MLKGNVLKDNILKCFMLKGRDVYEKGLSSKRKQKIYKVILLKGSADSHYYDVNNEKNLWAYSLRSFMYFCIWLKSSKLKFYLKIIHSNFYMTLKLIHIYCVPWYEHHYGGIFLFFEVRSPFSKFCLLSLLPVIPTYPF